MRFLARNMAISSDNCGFLAGISNLAPGDLYFERNHKHRLGFDKTSSPAPFGNQHGRLEHVTRISMNKISIFIGKVWNFFMNLIYFIRELLYELFISS